MVEVVIFAYMAIGIVLTLSVLVVHGDDLDIRWDVPGPAWLWAFVLIPVCWLPWLCSSLIKKP